MSAISGYAGTVLAGGTAVANFNNWNVSIKADNFDTSAFNVTGGWKDNLNGLKEWSGQFTGNYDVGDPGQLALQSALLGGVTIDLVLDTGNATGTSTVGSGGGTYTGTANITDWQVKTPVNNKVDVTVSFKGKGALTFS